MGGCRVWGIWSHGLISVDLKFMYWNPELYGIVCWSRSFKKVINVSKILIKSISSPPLPPPLLSRKKVVTNKPLREASWNLTLLNS